MAKKIVKKKFAGFPRLDEEVPAVAESIGIEKDSTRAYRHRVSQSSDCVRNLVMGIRGVPADARTGRMQVLLDDSSEHENLTGRWLDKTKFPVKESQRAVNVAKIPTKKPITRFKCDTCGTDISSDELHGHIDGLIFPDEVMLYEHKAISHFRFEQLGEQEKFPDDYVQQCCGYIVGLQNQGEKIKRAVLLIKNKNTSAYKQFGITYSRKDDTAQVIALWTGEAVYYKGVVKELIAKHIIIQRAIDDPKSPLPERPYAFDSLPCSWCRRKDKCWESYPEEVEKRKKDLALDPNSELAKDIRALVEARAVSNKAYEVSKDIRQKVAVGLAKLGIKSGDIWFDDGTAVNFGLNAMRRSFLDRTLIPPDVAAEATRFNTVEFVNARVIGSKKKNGKG